MFLMRGWQSQYWLRGKLSGSDPEVSLGSLPRLRGEVGVIDPPDGVSGAALEGSQVSRDRCPQCRGAGGWENKKRESGALVKPWAMTSLNTPYHK